jgi:hypothetical protein
LACSWSDKFCFLLIFSTHSDCEWPLSHPFYSILALTKRFFFRFGQLPGRTWPLSCSLYLVAFLTFLFLYSSRLPCSCPWLYQFVLVGIGPSVLCKWLACHEDWALPESISFVFLQCCKVSCQLKLIGRQHYVFVVGYFLRNFSSSVLLSKDLWTCLGEEIVCSVWHVTRILQQLRYLWALKC